MVKYAVIVIARKYLGGIQNITLAAVWIFCLAFVW
jgi:hypothetical protein